MVKLNEINRVDSQIKPEKGKNIYSKEAQIINCQVKEGKLITQLDDGREISILVSLLTKWSVLGKNVKPEQLEKWELQNDGRYIYFPNIDEILPAWIISKGLNASCFD